ncbi:methyl-accepting chemotaxis protein [Thalassotalea euphylliae]|uniref:Methyl-accepting chemotaxis protein n=1 Tax=Thalassotalea euphylliae TaxID=1655234 RepID=A0A3E0TR38_9GAMM|nr:methyl-accepting chemotaxis protein [Thalassotalea euphylliae]REL26472.1 methyl-accepting chemotaxis protein [Thalassotalea euphylliae]
MTSTLKFRLIIILVTIGLVPALIVGSGAFLNASNALEEYVFAKLISTRDVMKGQIEDYLESARKDILFLANSKDVNTLYKAAKVYRKLEETTPAERFNVDTYEYQDLWASKGSTLKNLSEINGYSDVLLITADTGHVVYSARQNADLGANLKANFDQNNPLANVWQRVVNNKTLQYQDYTPYQAQNNQPVAFIAAPVVDLKQQVVAVVVLQLSQDIINGITGQRSGMGETGESYLVGSDNLMRSDSYLAPNRFSVHQSFAAPALGKANSHAIGLALQGDTGVEITTSYLASQVLTAYTSITFGDDTWALISEIGEREAFSAVNSIKTIVLVILLIVGLIVVMSAIYISGSITSPVKQMTKFLDELALGHIGKRTNLNRKDEIGHMARSLDSLAHYLEHVTVKGLQHIAEGDLTQDVTPQDDEDVISHALIATNKDLTNVISNVTRFTDNLVVESEKVLTSSDSIYTSADQSQQALQSISTSLLEVGKVIDNTAEKTAIADDLGSTASQSAVAGKHQVERVVTAMEEIKSASDNISSILVAIEGIAAQTNLLALNAAIEAARAGEQGRGFAVVADEVRTLAAQSTQAANETAELVKVVVEKTEIGASLTLTSAESLTEIVDAVDQVSGIVGEISRAAAEQSQAVGEANENLIKIAEVNQQTSANAQQGLEVSQTLSSFSNGLKEVIAKFKIKL